MLNEEEILSMIGRKCGKLTVVEYAGYFVKEGSKKAVHWYKCQCECGNIVLIERGKLNPNSSKATKSCGCSRSTHGLSKHPLYIIYKDMIARVRRPHPYYHRKYIENNIGICEEWNNHPEVFINWALENGWEKGLTLDRIDNLGNYSPENCRFVTPLVQSNNRGDYNNNVTYNGKTQSIAMWARELGIHENTLRSRICNSKMTIEDALTTSVNSKFSHKDKD